MTQFFDIWNCYTSINKWRSGINNIVERFSSSTDVRFRLLFGKRCGDSQKDKKLPGFFAHFCGTVSELRYFFAYSFKRLPYMNETVATTSDLSFECPIALVVLKWRAFENEINNRGSFDSKLASLGSEPLCLSKICRFSRTRWVIIILVYYTTITMAWILSHSTDYFCH